MIDATVTGELFEPDSAKSATAELRRHNGSLLLVSGGRQEYLEPTDIVLSDHLASIPRRLTLPDGRVLVTRDHAAVGEIFAGAKGHKITNLIAASEIFRPRLMAILAVLFLAIVIALRFGIPLAADVAANLVPPGLEARLGRGALATFDLLIDESRLSTERQVEVRNLFESLRASSDLSRPVTLQIRHGGLLGPNAFALPGGPVIVTDELIELAPSDDALAGVLAHEIGHIEERHGLRRMLRAAGWVIMVSVIADDGSGLFEEVAAFPTLLIDQAYSRNFEIQADDRAIEILVGQGRDTDAFAEMLELIMAECGDRCGGAEWLASHPATSGRIDRIRAGRERTDN